MTQIQRSRWCFWGDLSSPELAREAPHAVALMPVSAIEQHGPHLPLSVDADLAQGILSRAAQMWRSDAAVLELPHLPVGFSAEHASYAGTLSLSATTLIRVWTEIAECVAASGVRKLLLFNTHGGQVGALDLVARDLRQRLGMLAVSSSWFQLPLADAMSAFDAHEQRFGVHAGQVETAMMLALRPQLVDMSLAKDFRSTSESRAATLPVLGDGRSAKLAWTACDLHPEGAVGQAHRATVEQGRALVEAAATGLVQLLDDIHRVDASSTVPR